MRHAAAILIALTLAASWAGAASAADHVIEINDMRFGPAPQHLKVGDTITWKNLDIVRHTATAKNGTFDLKLDPGKSAQTTLRASGAVTVFCRYHPDMTLRLTVTK